MSNTVSPSWTVYLTDASGNVVVGLGVGGDVRVSTAVGEGASFDSPELHAADKRRAATIMTAATSAGRVSLPLNGIAFLLRHTLGQRSDCRLGHSSPLIR
jgi:hypothetical protein